MTEFDDGLEFLLADKKNIEQARWGNLVSIVLSLSIGLFTYRDTIRHVSNYGWNVVDKVVFVEGVATYTEANPYSLVLASVIYILFSAVILTNQLIIRKYYYIVLESIEDTYRDREAKDNEQD